MEFYISYIVPSFHSWSW